MVGVFFEAIPTLELLSVHGSNCMLHKHIPLSANEILPPLKFFLSISPNTCVHSKNHLIQEVRLRES